jgi:hypothetical protein
MVAAVPEKIEPLPEMKPAGWNSCFTPRFVSTPSILLTPS